MPSTPEQKENGEDIEHEVPVKNYEKKVSKALLCLSTGSKYTQPDADVKDFRKRISTRISGTSKLNRDSKTISEELKQRATIIKELVETEREYLGELLHFQTVGNF